MENWRKSPEEGKEDEFYMETMKMNKRICLFCGQERNVRVFETDGLDKFGHQMCRPGRREVDSGCTCPLGKIKHEKQEIKKMCHNCKFYLAGSCVNKSMVNEVSSFFQMPKELKVIHPENHCKYWEINLDIFKILVRENGGD